MVEAGTLTHSQTASCTAEPTAVRVQNLQKRYGATLAVNGASLEITRGRIYGLIGPDGAGKSTVMKAVAGVLAFDSGVVEVFGEKVNSERAAERVKDRIGFMPQGLGLNLYPELSIEENVDFFAHLRLVPQDQLADRKRRLLEVTRLSEFRTRPMKNLSGGMKQKLGLVCTLIHQPELIVLDEPTTGVDPVSRRDFWAILTDLLREESVTALVSTAYMDEASRFHRMSLFYRGRVMASGSPEEIVALVPGSTVRLHAMPQMQAIMRLEEVFPQVEAFGEELRVFVESASPADAIQHVKKQLPGIAIKQIDTTEANLENVFLALLRRQVPEEALTGGPAVPEKPVTSGQAIAIEARQLVRDFGKFRAVHQVSFRVRTGEIFGLLGANGAGKTTIIKMLTGIFPPTAGEGWVGGVNLQSGARMVKQRIGYMSQAFSLYRDLTVLENIELYAGIYGLQRREARRQAAWIIEMAGLAGSERELAARLPMGLSQRLALGCALVHKPQILFLDEPTSGVDPLGRQRFWRILFELARGEGVTILITTHYMSEAEHCDHLALISAGQVIADASPAELKTQVEKEAGRLLEIGTSRPMEALQVLMTAGFDNAALFGNQIHLLSKNPEEDVPRVRSRLSNAGIATQFIRQQTLSMEDVFVYRVTQVEAEQHARRKQEAL